MRNLRIRTKILLSFGIILVLCGVFTLMVVSFKMYVFAAVVLAMSLALALYLANNIAKPLEFFAGVIAQIAETGNIYLDEEAYKKTKLFNKRGDEVGKISRSIGDMLAMFRNKINTLNAVAEGDLTVEIARRSAKDTIGVALVGMVDSLNVMFHSIQSASGQVSVASHQLMGGAEELAQGSGEQATAIEHLSATIGTIAGQTAQNAQMAREAAGLSQSIKLLAEKGGEQMEAMIDAVNQINESSDEISKVIKVIDDIAFQTNILALNAAVEAARAGQHGKGFAVVAEEVRSLASKSQESAQDTGVLIADSISKARLGAKIAGETSASLNEIVNGVNKSTLLVGEIARSSDEQATAIAEINSGLDQVNHVVRRNNDTAAKSAYASKEVSEQSSLLQESIAQFKIKGGAPRLLAARTGE